MPPTSATKRQIHRTACSTKASCLRSRLPNKRTSTKRTAYVHHQREELLEALRIDVQQNAKLLQQNESLWADREKMNTYRFNKDVVEIVNCLNDGMGIPRERPTTLFASGYHVGNNFLR